MPTAAGKRADAQAKNLELCCSGNSAFASQQQQLKQGCCRHCVPETHLISHAQTTIIRQSNKVHSWELHTCADALTSQKGTDTAYLELIPVHTHRPPSSGMPQCSIIQHLTNGRNIPRTGRHCPPVSRPTVSYSSPRACTLQADSAWHVCPNCTVCRRTAST